MITSFIDWTTTEAEAMAYQQLAGRRDSSESGLAGCYAVFERTTARTGKAPGSWATGVPHKTLMTSTRLANGTIISESEYLWSATDLAGNRVTLDRRTSEVTVDRRVLRGNFVEFTEAVPLGSYFFSPGSRDRQEAIDALLWLLLKSR